MPDDFFSITVFCHDLRMPLNFKRSLIGLSLATVVASAFLSAGLPTTAQAESRWKRDYNYNFNGPQDDSKWGRYGWGDQPVNQGAMGNYKPENVYNRDGVMALRTQYRDGQWSSAGVSGNPSFSAVGGKWEVRAKMPRAKGIGYAFLLFPTDGGWPPEIDIAEGRVNGKVMSVYHWGTPENHQQAQSYNSVNTQEWHTYGVIIEENRVVFTIDGDHVTGVLDNVPTLNKRMWLGFQTGAMDPWGEARDYETIDGGVPNDKTPAVAEIEIDWVAHYTN